MNYRSLSKMTLISLGFCMLFACSSTKAPETGPAPVQDGGTQSAAVTEGLGDNATVSGTGDDSSLSSGLSGATLKIENQTYYFDYDRSTVRDNDRASLEAQARFLVEHPKAKVRLEGYTDPRGSREYNIALGERRANAVADFLKLQGVAAKQIQTLSYGAEKLASQGHEETDYQLDRRAVLVYVQK